MASAQQRVCRIDVRLLISDCHATADRWCAPGKSTSGAALQNSVPGRAGDSFEKTACPARSL